MPVGFGGGGPAMTVRVTALPREPSTVLTIGPSANARTGAVLGPREFVVDHATSAAGELGRPCDRRRDRRGRGRRLARRQLLGERQPRLHAGRCLRGARADRVPGGRALSPRERCAMQAPCRLPVDERPRLMGPWEPTVSESIHARGRPADDGTPVASRTGVPGRVEPEVLGHDVRAS